MLARRSLCLTESCSKLIDRSKVTMSPISPPACVKGMKEWRPELFNKEVSLPCLVVQADKLNRLKNPLKDYTLKLQNFSSVQDFDEPGKRGIVLNPDIVKHFSDLNSLEEVFKETQVSGDNLVMRKFELTSENWKPQEKLKYILPDDSEAVTGFSRIGHIIHLNLKDHTLEYKDVIGKVLLEITGIKTVVTKSSNIDNTFRNFELEVLAGENNFEVTVKENGVRFSLDFSKVYWNPRLSTEHERIVKMMGPSSILFDACAGVGPFAIPSAKKCRVFANDLNPESFKWLQNNAKLNKIKPERMSCHNMDARQFIQTVFLQEMISLCKSDNRDILSECEVHITMNLPALAVTFLDVFQGLFTKHEDKIPKDVAPLPLLHVYTFSKEEDSVQDVRSRVEHYLGSQLEDKYIKEISFVRNVAPNKDMLRASVQIPPQVLYLEEGDKRKLDNQTSSCKRVKQ